MYRYTKCILLLPHVAGVCSACNDFQQRKQIYNSVKEQTLVELKESHLSTPIVILREYMVQFDISFGNGRETD